MATRRGLKDPCYQPIVKPHEQAIRDLVDSHPQIYRNGFWKAVEALADKLDADITRQPFIPDAYSINHEKSEIVIYEVVSTHDLSDDKLAMMGMFWFDWDSEGAHDWLPRLIVKHVRYPDTEIDLCRAYHVHVLGRHRGLSS